MASKSIITIAVGNSYFYSLADNLVNSFLLWNKYNDIVFTLVTDNPSFFQNQTSEKIIIKTIEIPTKDKNFTSKFHLYEYAECQNNLFIDCDCLIYRDLTNIFTELSSNNFTAIGSSMTHGSFFCDIEKVIQQWKLKTIPVFVGSIYFFKKNKVSEAIFRTAIELKNKYDEYGFIRLREQENEEPLFAVAMSINNEKPYQNNLALKCDAMFYQHIDCNILTGKMNLIVRDQNISSIYKNFSTKEAYIIHFNAHFSDSWPYKLDAYRLKHVGRYNQIKRLYAWIMLKKLPLLISYFKETFRPLFRILFGTRKIKKNKRTKHFDTY